MSRPNARYISKILYLMLGTAVAGFAIAVFITPAKIASGGVNGIATIIYHRTGWDTGATMLIISVPLFLIGMKVFGKTYGATSLAGTLLLSAWVSLFGQLTGYQGILPYVDRMDTLLSAIFGGVLLGSGIGIVMRTGANTGGTDILTQIVSRYTPLPLGTALFLVDGFVIILGALNFGLERALFAVITLYLSGQMVNYMVMNLGTKYAKTPTSSATTTRPSGGGSSVSCAMAAPSSQEWGSSPNANAPSCWRWSITNRSTFSPRSSTKRTPRRSCSSTRPIRCLERGSSRWDASSHQKNNVTSSTVQIALKLIEIELIAPCTWPISIALLVPNAWLAQPMATPWATGSLTAKSVINRGAKRLPARPLMMVLAMVRAEMPPICSASAMATGVVTDLGMREAVTASCKPINLLRRTTLPMAAAEPASVPRTIGKKVESNTAR